MRGISAKLPAAKYLRECFKYSRSTGKLFWRKRPVRHFKSHRVPKWWNKKYASKEAFRVNNKGYRQGDLDSTTFLAHRVIWKMVTGEEPPRYIDHKDHNKTNNRWKNLREATNSQNCFSKKKPKNYFSGIHRHKNLWRARVGSRKNRIEVGLFQSKDAARVARQLVVQRVYGEFVI